MVKKCFRVGKDFLKKILKKKDIKKGIKQRLMNLTILKFTVSIQNTPSRKWKKQRLDKDISDTFN